MPIGFLFGILTAFLASFQNTQIRSLKTFSPYFLNALRFSAGVLVTALIVTFFSEWRLPSLWVSFLILCFVVPLEIATAYGYVRAFQYSPQSLVGPLFSFSMVFLIPASYILVGELPSPRGFLGVGSIFVGGFILSWDAYKPGIRNALFSIFRERGSYFMLTAALTAGFSVAMIKFSLQYFPPVLFAFWTVFALMLLHLPAFFIHGFFTLREKWKPAFLMAGAFGVGQALHYIGISLIVAVYFISLKRLSNVFDVLFGRILGGEDHFLQRFIGALFMVAGAVFVAFG
ncbi:MAG: DMT family transporter [Candidatus Sungbacteria bacterium]|nr:DMT family transporter [Candidatus Sungbacteria bacterium]